MRTWQNLNTNCIVIDSMAKNKKEVFTQIAKIASKSPLLANQSEENIFDKLMERESISSTCLANQIALPHCSFKELEDFVVGLIRTKSLVDFNSTGNKDTQLFIFIIGPESMRNKHIQILSSIAKAVSVKATANLLMRAQDSDMILDIFTSQINILEKIIKSSEKSDITIIVQKEKYFDDLIQTLSSEDNISLVVYECESASRYLHKLPLFASFWGGLEESFCRVISIIADRAAVNSIIGKVKSIDLDIESESGLLLTVSDINYSLGSLDL
jgi:PTS system nitrogen regulatory IIA component